MAVSSKCFFSIQHLVGHEVTILKCYLLSAGPGHFVVSFDPNGGVR